VHQCTPSHEPYLRSEHVRPGLFIAAVGADSPEKQELDPALFGAATVVVDLLEQCAAVGELHHALDAGTLAIGDVHSDLASIVVGARKGRTRGDEVIIFDATGTALQDAAAAAAAFNRAVALKEGNMFDFFSRARSPR
jgi:ornithine cyclodeaminase/alanine dehydrogenase-like protein (mu-crystallin family)